MKLDELKSIAVVGAGTMGQGIAQLCAMAGYKTLLYDISQDALKNALEKIEENLDKGIEKGKVSQEIKTRALSNLTLVGHLEELKVDMVIEAAIEKLEVKRELFKKLEAINEPSTILATNTSSIPITQIGAALEKPERLVGMHFFNPAHIMKLVEVISGAATSSEIAGLTKSLAEKLGKVAVEAKDAPGFIVNRVARHFYVESLNVLEENVASYDSIDRILKSNGFRMGPFELMDLIGVDTNFSVTSSMYAAFHYNSKFRPSRIQQQKVDAGHHGRKSGKGFYSYDR